MRNLWRVVLGSAAALAISAGNVEAQRFGVQGNWGDDADFGIGARVELGLPNLFTTTGPLANTFLIGSFDYFFPDNDAIDYWELNANLAIPLVASGIDPYVGAGLNVAHVSIDSDLVDDASDTEIGLNLLGGLRIPMGGVATFVEGRFELGGGEQFVLTFGALLGGN